MVLLRDVYVLEGCAEAEEDAVHALDHSSTPFFVFRDLVSLGHRLACTLSRVRFSRGGDQVRAELADNRHSAQWPDAAGGCCSRSTTLLSGHRADRGTG